MARLQNGMMHKTISSDEVATSDTSTHLVVINHKLLLAQIEYLQYVLSKI